MRASLAVPEHAIGPPRRKRLLPALVLGLVVLTPGAAWAEHPYGPPRMNAWVLGPVQRGVSVAVEQKRRATVPTHPVSFTAEPYATVLPAGLKRMRESALPGGLALDLDGDGKTRTQWPARCDGRDLLIGDWRISPLGTDLMRYPTELARLGPRGGWVVLYGDCGPRAMVGFSPPTQPVRIEQRPGPLLQISLIEKGRGLGRPPALTVSSWLVDGKPVPSPHGVVVRANEPVDAEKAEWLLVHWFLVPIPAKGTHVVDFQVRGEGAAIAAAAVNVAPAPGQRWRGPFAGRELPER